MEDVFFIQLSNHAFVSIAELNQVINACSNRLNLICAIRMNNPVDRLDIAFVGGLYLLFKERDIRFNITGVVNDGEVYSSVSKHKSELCQFRSQLHSLYHDDIHWIRVAGVATPEDDFIKTMLFAPLLFIDQSLLYELFINNGEGIFSVLKNSYKLSLNGETNKLENTYFAEITEDHIFTWLDERAPIYTFVYCILHKIGRPFVEKKNMDIVLNRIKEIQSFTESYVAGLMELAKNIVFHSSTKRGIISIGSYGVNNTRIRDIETYVLDYGTKGIVPTMIMELDPFSEADEEDRKILNDGYKLKHLFNPGQSHRLLRQIRREMAHLGLIHFISVIRTNAGKCGISSYALDGITRDYYGDGSIDELPCIGTNFHFTLRLAKDIELKGQRNSGEYMRTTIDSIAAMPSIFEISKYIHIITLSKLYVGTRTDEQQLVDSIPFDNPEFKYFAVDFIDINISATSLLRVLAMMSERTDKGIIVFNIQSEVFSDMIISNDTYFRQLNDIDVIPYWIKGKSILIYSRLRGHDFYFADILYGDNVQAFQSINRISFNTFPNYITITSNPIEETLVDNSLDLPVRHFFHKSTLLPFDLCLNNKEGQPLFYTNLMFLLNKPLM